MAEIFKILGVAIITTVAAILLKGTKPELSFAVTVTGVIIILLFIVESLQGVLIIFQTITAATGIESELMVSFTSSIPRVSVQSGLSTSVRAFLISTV